MYKHAHNKYLLIYLSVESVTAKPDKMLDGIFSQQTARSHEQESLQFFQGSISSIENGIKRWWLFQQVGSHGSEMANVNLGQLLAYISTDGGYSEIKNVTLVRFSLGQWVPEKRNIPELAQNHFRSLSSLYNLG